MNARRRYTADALRELFTYEPDTGILRWKVDRPRGVKAGDEAGCAFIASCGKKYRRISIRGKYHGAHLVIWCLQTGVWPDHEIDHRDNDGLNNRWANLRAATRKQNSKNRTMPSNNTSGYKGVNFDKKARKWVAQIGSDGKKIYLGRFEDPKEAHAAYCAAADKLHGEFANHG
ncbi:HNH endonuclease [Burkholderia anthina]|uniref:HNH endonuclease n=1 Tax=Burkholderia anthina TaxID=179879 RepID=A0A7T6VIX7_9BURK|nr:HNH endonuclease [Burkholderia anthina]QQK04793.1 HNH endonuclease [Burkholderia anthina]